VYDGEKFVAASWPTFGVLCQWRLLTMAKSNTNILEGV
jgi:hypothetical protein